MGQVSSTAAMYKVSVEQVASAYATLTKNGVDTAQSGTAINAMLSELGESGTGVSKILKEKTGKSFAELMGSGKSLTDVLKIIDDEAKKNGKSIGDMFNNKESIKGAANLVQHSNDFSDALTEMGKNSNITEDKMKKLSNTTGTSLKKSFNDLKLAGIQMGDTLSPVISAIASAFKSVTNVLSQLSPQMRTVIASVSLGVVAFTGVTKAISGISGTISTCINGFGKLKTFMAGTSTAANLLSKVGSVMFNPWTLAIGAVIGIIVVLWNKCDWFRNGVINIFNGIKNAFKTCADFLSNAWTGVKNVFKSVVDFMAQAWNGFINILKTVLSPIIDWIKQTWQGFKDFFNGICQGIKSIWDRICNGIKNIFNGIVGFIKQAWNGFKNVFNSVCNGISKIWSNICNGIKKVFKPVVDFVSRQWNGIKRMFEGAKSALLAPFKYLSDKIGGIWDSIRGAIKLPHFHMSGSFSLNPPSVPSIGVK